MDCWVGASGNDQREQYMAQAPLACNQTRYQQGDVQQPVVTVAPRFIQTQSTSNISQPDAAQFRPVSEKFGLGDNRRSATAPDFRTGHRGHQLNAVPQQQQLAGV